MNSLLHDESNHLALFQHALAHDLRHDLPVDRGARSEHADTDRGKTHARLRRGVVLMMTPDSYFWRQKNDNYIYMHKQNNDTLYYLLSNGSENSKTKGGNVSTLVISQLVFQINETLQYVTVSRKNNSQHIPAACLPYERDSNDTDTLLALIRLICYQEPLIHTHKGTLLPGHV